MISYFATSIRWPIHPYRTESSRPLIITPRNGPERILHCGDMQSLQDIGAFRPDAFDEPDRKIPEIGSARTHHFGGTGSMPWRILQLDGFLSVRSSKRLNEQCSGLQSSALLIEGKRRV